MNCVATPIKISLGRVYSEAFPEDDCYQASIDRWNAVYEQYQACPWSKDLFDLARNIIPLTQSPSLIFRRILAELKSSRGEFDPEKKAHQVIFFDVLASAFILWAQLGRDIRRFSDSSMRRNDFDQILKYYLWGGKDSYLIKQQIKEKIFKEGGGSNEEFPAWPTLLSFAGLVALAPQSILECSSVCREISLRLASSPNENFDKKLVETLTRNNRVRQLAGALGDYLVMAGKLPNDLSAKARSILYEF
jgi:hypothetical protein